MSVFLLWFIFISAASVREIQTPCLLCSWQSRVFGSNFLQEVNYFASCSLALCKHHSQTLPGVQGLLPAVPDCIQQDPALPSVWLDPMPTDCRLPYETVVSMSYHGDNKSWGCSRCVALPEGWCRFCLGAWKRKWNNMRLQVPLPGTTSCGHELLGSSSCLCSELSNEHISPNILMSWKVLLSW